MFPSQIPCFQVWGSNPSQGTFSWCDSNDNSLLINRKNSSKNILHWLTVAESWEKGKNPTKWSWLGFEPQTWKHGIPRPGNMKFDVELAQYVVEEERGKRPMIAYCFTQCSNGCSLGSFLFPRQQIHGQRCGTLRRFFSSYLILYQLCSTDENDNHVTCEQTPINLKVFWLFNERFHFSPGKRRSFEAFSFHSSRGYFLLCFSWKKVKNDRFRCDFIVANFLFFISIGKNWGGGGILFEKTAHRTQSSSTSRPGARPSYSLETTEDKSLISNT